MINDSKNDFMSSVELTAEEWRSRAYEEYMTGFLTKTIKQSTVLNIPKNVDFGTKERIFKESTATISETAKKVINNGFLDDENSLHDVNFAHEIEDPKNFSESVQKLLAEHIFNEEKDRISVLEAKFDSGEFNNLSVEEVAREITDSFESISFEDKFDNGKNLKHQMDMLLSIEGETVLDSIKNDLIKQVEETEEKNKIVRDVNTQIYETKDIIEGKINGDSEDPNDDNKQDEKGDSENPDKEQTTEGWYNKSLKKNKTFTKKDLYEIYDYSNDIDVSSRESLENIFDDSSFSRETAQQILQEFQELDGVDTESIPDNNEDVLSLSSGEEEVTDDGDNNAESSENTYYDDDGREIEIDHDKFKYDPEEHKAKELKDDDDDDEDDNEEDEGDDDDDFSFDFGDDDESEESLAKDFVPLSFERLHYRKITCTPKLSAFLALKHDGGKLFFDEVGRRAAEMYNMLSKEDSIADNINKDTINREIEDRMETVNDIKEKTDTLMNDLGILGILSGNFQRTDSPTQNATVALFNPKILTPKDSPHISKEELHEHELADILKIGMSISEVKSDIANGVDVSGNKGKLGYLDELLNEKMFKLDPNEKMDVESRIGALQSIESIIPIKDIVDMKVFVSKSANTDKQNNKIIINSLKDIDAYGYSYEDEIDRIKKEVKKNYKDSVSDKEKVIDFDIDRLVEFVVDEVDTTKFDTNLYESIITKIASNIDVSNSSEGLIVLNKARALTTSFITADKLGFLSKNELRNIRALLM